MTMMDQKHFQTLRALSHSGYAADQVAEGLNRDSRANAKRWSQESIETDLATPQRLPIGWKNDDLSTLTRLRIYEVRDALEQKGLESSWWFVAEQLSANMWLIDNPFLMRSFSVSFHEDERIDGFWYDTGDAKIKTSNLIEAILLSQP